MFFEVILARSYARIRTRESKLRSEKVAGLGRCPELLFRLLFTFQNVDDFVAVGAHDFNKVQQGLTPSHKYFNINQLRSTQFYRF